MEHTNKILVIGGVHLDILTNYIDSTANTNFRDGTISIGIGGVGFNITANLKYNNFVGAKLFTVINNPDESFSGMLIQDALKKRGMSMDYVKIDNRELVSEIGFIGVMNQNNDFEFGITFTGIDSFDFKEKELESAIADSEVIVIDCNLESIQINTVREFCLRHSKPLFICSVSENRVKRALKFENKYNFKYKAFALNRNEIKKAVEQQSKLKTWESFHKKSDIRNLCNFFHTEYLIVTAAQERYVIFSSSGSRKDGPRFNIPGVMSALGADDALFAAIVAYYTKHRCFNWDECQDMMRTFLTKVLRSHTTTPSIEKKRSEPACYPVSAQHAPAHQSIQLTHNSTHVTNNYNNASLEEIQKLIRTVKSEVLEAAFLSPQQKEWISNHTAVIEEDVNKNENPSESKQKEWYNQLCQFVGLISNSIKIADILPLWS